MRAAEVAGPRTGIDPHHLALIMGLARQPGGARAADVVRVTGKSPATATRYLAALTACGELVKSGAGAGTRYRAAG